MIAKVGRVVGIVHEVYETAKGLVPAWVSSKSPNPTHNNGLLIVIKGKHCGKYVRKFTTGTTRTMVTSSHLLYWL